MARKYVLLEESIGGVIAVTDDPVIAVRLHRGILDSKLVWTYDEFDPDSPACTGFAQRRFKELQKEFVTERFTKRCELARIRLPAFVIWRQVVIDELDRMKDFYVDVDRLLEQELAKSDREKLSSALAEFADISERSPAETFAYLELGLEERSTKLLRAYAFAEKWTSRINASNTSEEAAETVKAMRAESRIL